MDLDAVAFMERAGHTYFICYSFPGGAQKLAKLDLWGGGDCCFLYRFDDGGEDL